MSQAVHTNDARAFHYALLASILLHALLLQLFAQPRESSRPLQQPPLVARLVEPPVPPSAPAVEERPAPAAKKPAPAARRRPAPVAKPQPAVPAPEPEPEPLAQSPVEQPLAPQAAAAAEPEPAQKDTRAADPPPPVAQPREPVPEFDPKLLATYRLEIIHLARQFKRYPPLARENNWEGRAEVRLSFAPGGRRPSIDLLKSSGYPVLDRQAIDTMSKAVVPVPEALRGRQFALDVPVIFNLDD